MAKRKPLAGHGLVRRTVTMYRPAYHDETEEYLGTKLSCSCGEELYNQDSFVTHCLKVLGADFNVKEATP